MNSEKTLKNDENTEKEHKLSGYDGIGHLCKGIIRTTRLLEIREIIFKDVGLSRFSTSRSCRIIPKSLYSVCEERLSASMAFQPHMTGPTTGTWPLSGPKNVYKK